MDTTFEDFHSEAKPQSVKASWRYFKKLGSASTKSEAWSYLKKSIETLPTWALIVGVVGLVVLVANPAIVMVPLAAGAALAAVYMTVKHAVKEALREHDREQLR